MDDEQSDQNAHQLCYKSSGNGNRGDSSINFANIRIVTNTRTNVGIRAITRTVRAMIRATIKTTETW